MRRWPAIVPVWIVLSAIHAPAISATSRHLAIVVDTSNSMSDNDPQRYTMQLSQVLSDLVDTGDELSVIRMPLESGFFTDCSAGPSSSLVLRLDPANRPGFKRDLDGLIQFNTGTFFAAPIRTAISLLPPDPNARRMLLVIADSGGLGDCGDALTEELLDLKRSGVTIAAINLGGTSGAFDNNPAFDFTTSALDAQGLTQAVALVYQRFLGAKQVQTGQVDGDITVEIAPYVDEAFLVVAADGPIGALSQVAPNPSATSIDLNHRGGGSTQGIDGVQRRYRIARLERPGSGAWHFHVSGAGERAGWMLLQDSAVGVRMISSQTLPKGVEVPLEVELFDQRTGLRIADTSKLPGLGVTLEMNGREVAFRDDGQGGDRQAGDGTFTATTTFDQAGDPPLAVHLQSAFLDRKIPITARIIDANWRLDVQTPKRAEVDQAMTLSVTLQPIGSAAALRLPDRIDVLTGGPVVGLRDDGTGADRQAGDRTFTGSWTPTDTGTVHLDYVPVGGSLAAQASGQLDVLGRLRFGRPSPVQFGRLRSETDAIRQLDLSSADVRGGFDLQVTTSFECTRTVMEIDLGNGWVCLGSQPLKLRLAQDGRKSWPLRLRVGECPDAYPAGKAFGVIVAGVGADGNRIQTVVPVTAEIVADSWLQCWWPIVALTGGGLLAAIAFHGFWSPSRFPPSLGVVLSTEEDEEGFFQGIRGESGSGSSFYRDARVFVCQDPHRLSGKPRNAVARLRADRKQIRIAPAPGCAVWRRNAEGTWEQIQQEESTARFGDLYRNEPGTLFFELRNA